MIHIARLEHDFKAWVKTATVGEITTIVTSLMDELDARGLPGTVQLLTISLALESYREHARAIAPPRTRA